MIFMVVVVVFYWLSMKLKIFTASPVIFTGKRRAEGGEEGGSGIKMSHGGTFTSALMEY